MKGPGMAGLVLSEMVLIVQRRHLDCCIVWQGGALDSHMGEVEVLAAKGRELAGLEHTNFLSPATGPASYHVTRNSISMFGGDSHSSIV